MKSVILAAGIGSRFKQQGVPVPKPLIRLGGLTLVERTVRSQSKAGISEFVIVVGDYLEQVRSEVGPRLKPIKVQWLHNEDWKAGNGTTLLAAQRLLKNESHFLVTMCDHLLFPKTLEKLTRQPLKNQDCLIAIDRKIQLVSDVSDATKVCLADRKVIRVGKKLNPFDAIDIGASVCSPRVFQELSELYQANPKNCLHREAMNRLAEKGFLYPHDIEEDGWEDIDDIPAHKSAEKILFNSLRKPTDGFLSRNVERYLSLSVTRLLAKTSLKPNHVTFFIIFLGAVAAFLFSQPVFYSQVAGSLLFWFSSFLDGCDGELARLKFMETRLGGWLDLWSDNFIHMMVFGGIGLGLYRNSGETEWIYWGLTAILGVFLSVSIVSWATVRKKKHDGPLFTSVADQSRSGHAGMMTARLIRLSDALSRRDFIFWLIFVTLLGWLPAFIIMAALGSVFYFLTLSFIQWRLRCSRA